MNLRWMLRGTMLAVTGGALLLPSPDARADCEDGRPMNVGHRGTGNSSAENPFPENTLPSIMTAVEEGATMVEIDVQLSADMVPVLMHDLTVEGTTDGMGCVSELTVEQLQQLDAAAGTPMEGMGVQVPTLEEVLDAVTVDLDVELKLGGDGCATFGDAEYVTAVLDVLDADPAGREFIVTSFDFPLIEEARAQDAELRIGQIAISWASAAPAAEAGFDALVLSEASADETGVMMVREAGLDLFVWTVNEPERMAELLALDVDAIITDEPPLLEEARAEVCPSEGEDSTGDEPPNMDSTGTGMPPGGTAGGQESTTGPAPGDGSTSSGTPADGGDADEGCGCRSARPAGSWTLLGLLGLLGLRRRRRVR